ncbi:MAG: TIGR00159 family protein [Pedosphaera sp.]|nr:TIGR00159 family protein [Pedosphaera sp.]
MSRSVSLELLHPFWRPALEIVILALGIYYAFIFIRGTRGAPVVTGFLGLLLAATLITKLLQLDVLTALLTEFFAFLPFAVVVIFQPELRRLLAELGNLPIFNSTREQRENIAVIIQAVDRLAPVKIGALIALEQRIQLSDVVEAGLPVDCEATPEMLETIFFPNNAIHDGGVIIKGDRILRAACMFPLSQKPNLPKSLGTRHRAALGLSEETDAVVIVVSEETGAISYAWKGELKRGIRIEELQSALTQLLVRNVQPRGIWDWLRHFANVIRTPAGSRASKEEI